LFVGGIMPYLRYFSLLAYIGVQHILWCVLFLLCFVYHRPVYPMLPVFLGCPFLSAPSIFSNIY
jgi:hypothetical protein